ncbi:MAG: carbohydrate kinase family protein [Sphaerochaeta sp.]
MKKKYSVLVTGYPSMDHIIKINSPAKVGFTSIVQNKSNSSIFYGGCSVNIAFALSRLGLPSVPVMRVGADFESNGFKDFLNSENVPLVGINKVQEENTSTSYLLEDNNGDHITIFYPGAMKEEYFKEVPDDLFEQSELGVITVGPTKDNIYFASKCLEHKLPMVFCMKGDMSVFTQDFLIEILNNSKVIFTNESERETIEEILNINSITDFFDSGICEVIVTTKGKDGSTYYYKEDELLKEGFVAAYDLFEKKDTTGCGDGYISGFLYGYLNNYSIKESCLYGSIVSSFVLSEEGCCTRLPKTSELKKEFTIRRND